MSNFFTKAFASVSIGFVLLLFILLFRSIVYFPIPKSPTPCSDDKSHDPIVENDHLINRFVQALRFKTITTGFQNYDKDELTKFVHFIIKSYPILHSSSNVKYEIVNNHSLLYTIKGSDSSLKPYLLCGHLDVVPVEEDKWEVDPFGGVIKDGYIYGRGSIDVKNIVMAILESLEFLLKKGFKPKRSFYIAFGHDEEGQGLDGASHIAQALRSKGVKEIEYLLDEGTVIFNQSFPGVNNLVAVVGVTEKGYLTLKLTAQGSVGHSSMAPPETSIVTLARAVSKFRSDVHINCFGLGPEWDFFESIAPYASYPFKLIYSNLWFFGFIFSRILSTIPSTNGLVRTTSAVTVINGGFKENVLPSTAFAYINHRVHPSQTLEDVINYDKELINDDRISVEIIGLRGESHPISPYDSTAFGYQAIKRSLQQVFPGTAVIPGIMIATTDTRWYLNFTKAVYRFSPSVLLMEDTIRFHGHNERLSVENYVKTVNYYHHIILTSDQKQIDDGTIVKDEL